MSNNVKSALFFIFVGSLLVASCGNKTSKKQEARRERQSRGGSVTASNAWARPGSKGANSAVYLNIKNSTDKADTLLRISSEVAEKAELHKSYTENGMSGMRRVGEKVLTSDSTLTLQPGGYHIMLIKLKRQLSEGDSVRLTLHFSTSGAQKINAPVKLPQ